LQQPGPSERISPSFGQHEERSVDKKAKVPKKPKTATKAKGSKTSKTQ
jgi:hypothetical protein